MLTNIQQGEIQIASYVQKVDIDAKNIHASITFCVHAYFFIVHAGKKISSVANVQMLKVRNAFIQDWIQ